MSSIDSPKTKHQRQRMRRKTNKADIDSKAEQAMRAYKSNKPKKLNKHERAKLDAEEQLREQEQEQKRMKAQLKKQARLESQKRELVQQFRARRETYSKSPQKTEEYQQRLEHQKLKEEHRKRKEEEKQKKWDDMCRKDRNYLKEEYLTHLRNDTFRDQHHQDQCYAQYLGIVNTEEIERQERTRLEREVRQEQERVRRRDALRIRREQERLIERARQMEQERLRKIKIKHEKLQKAFFYEKKCSKYISTSSGGIKCISTDCYNCPNYIIAECGHFTYCYKCKYEHMGIDNYLTSCPVCNDGSTNYYLKFVEINHSAFKRKEIKYSYPSTVIIEKEQMYELTMGSLKSNKQSAVFKDFFNSELFEKNMLSVIKSFL